MWSWFCFTFQWEADNEMKSVCVICGKNSHEFEKKPGVGSQCTLPARHLQFQIAKNEIMQYVIWKIIITD